MPKLSRFYGIVIKMYFADHSPPYFHAEYSGKRLSSVSIHSRFSQVVFRHGRWDLSGSGHRTAPLLASSASAVSIDSKTPLFPILSAHLARQSLVVVRTRCWAVSTEVLVDHGVRRAA